MGLWHYAEVLRFCWILCLKVELTSNSCTSHVAYIAVSGTATGEDL